MKESEVEYYLRNQLFHKRKLNFKWATENMLNLFSAMEKASNAFENFVLQYKEAGKSGRARN